MGFLKINSQSQPQVPGHKLVTNQELGIPGIKLALSHKIVQNIILACDGKPILTQKTILPSYILQLKFKVSGTIYQPSRSVALDIEKMKESCYVYSFFYT